MKNWNAKNCRKGLQEDLLDKQITSIAMNTAEFKKGTTKYCSQGKLDLRYPENIPAGAHFNTFAKHGKVKNGLTE